jgi:hypothetical protein
MKLIISQSQLKNITQKVISEQFSNPEDYTIGSYLKKEVERQKRAKEPKGVGYGIFQTGKGWSSGTPFDTDFGEIVFDNYPLGDIKYINVNEDNKDENWYFTKDGGFYVTDKNNTKIGDGTWKFSNGHVVINYGGRFYNSGTYQWTNPNVNCASSLEEIEEGGIKILKYGCKTDAVKELQKLLGMEEKYQTGYFGPITKGKVKEYQTSNGLKVDGIVGSKTYEALTTQTTEPEKTDTSGLGVDDDIVQFNKLNNQQTNESISTLKKVFNKLK